MVGLIKSYEKNMANTGLALLYPVSVMGERFRTNGIPHHVTIKFFDKPGVSVDDAHDYASNQNIQKPNPDKIIVNPKTFKNRFGEDVHVLSLEGEGIDHIKEINAKGSHLGQPVSYSYVPHISVDKELHDFVKSIGRPLKASELNISFDPPELKHGHRTIATYGNLNKSIWSGLVSSEFEPSELKKSKFTQAATTTAALLGLIGAPKMSGMPNEKFTPPSLQEERHSSVDKDRMLRAIAAVESSSGKNVSHAPIPGDFHEGESAYGRYGLTPVVIKETIDKHPDLRRNFKEAIGLKGQDFKNYMDKNPNLEHEVASRHLDRVQKLFGNNPAKIGYAWLSGIKGTFRADQRKVDFENHWHAKKVKNAYEKIKKINSPKQKRSGSR